VYRQKDSLFITKHASIRTLTEKDSMFIHAKKIIVTGKTGERTIRGFNNVRFFTKDMSGKCDSIHSSQKTRLTQLIGKPVLWNAENQLTGDLMHLIGEDKTDKLDSLKVLNNAFIVSKDTVGTGYNQVKGMNLYSKFKNNKIYQTDIVKNTEVIFYLRNDKQELVGIDKKVSSRINMIMDDQSKIESVTFFTNVEGDTYPEAELPENARKLRGFVWRGDERIKTKDEIFPEEEVELDKKIVAESRLKYQKESLKLTELLESEEKELSKFKVMDYVLDANFKPKYTDTNVKIVLDAVVPKDDKFQVYYTHDKTNNFNEMESEIAIVKGNIKNQRIVFYLSEDVKITNLRIDLGENPHQGEIKINSIEIVKNDKRFKVKNKEILSYFILAYDVKYNSDKGTFNHISLKKNGIVDPTIINNEKIIKQLKKMF
jgi:hypothetical protein